MSKKKEKSASLNPRLGKVGGQAVMEGVMMRSPHTTATAVRRMDDQTIVVRSKPTTTVRTKHKILNLPILRGVVNLVEMFILSFATLTASTEMMGLDAELEAEEPSKFDQWLDRHFGKNIINVISGIAMVLGVVLALGLFVALPAGATNLLFPNRMVGSWVVVEDGESTEAHMRFEKDKVFTTVEEVETEFPYVYKNGTLEIAKGLYNSELKVKFSGNKAELRDSDGKTVKTLKRDGVSWNNYLKCLVEGIIKVAIFIAYLALTSLMKEIKRVYQYHGAEHKTIFCYEKGLDLTVENVRMQKRFHPRCGTSFMFVMVFLSIFISIVFISNVWGWLRILMKLLLLPLCVGVGYEFIRFAGKHDNFLTRALSAPGLWMQRITTREPDDSMIEVAIVAVKSALHEEYPDFVIPYEDEYLKQKETNQSKETVDATAGIQNENS